MGISKKVTEMELKGCYCQRTTLKLSTRVIVYTRTIIVAMRLDHNLVGLKHIQDHLLDEFIDLAVNMTFGLFKSFS